MRFVLLLTEASDKQKIQLPVQLSMIGKARLYDRIIPQQIRLSGR